MDQTFTAKETRFVALSRAISPKTIPLVFPWEEFPGILTHMTLRIQPGEHNGWLHLEWHSTQWETGALADGQLLPTDACAIEEKNPLIGMSQKQA